MADSEFTCDSCQHCAGDCVETLSCGHYLCGVCSCRMESLTIMCPLCEEGNESEDCDILSCSEDLSIQSKIPVQILAKETLPTIPVITLEESDVELSPSACSVASNMSVDENSGSQMQQVVNESNVVHVMDTENSISGNFEENFHVKIDKALIVANDTLHHIDSAFQTLKDQDTRNKMLERRISNSMNEIFGKLKLALKKRKSDLLTDLRAVSEVYTAELQNAMKNLQEQKKCLETRVAFAKGLKQSPSLTIYCDLNQLVADLKVGFKNEFTPESLKESSNIRFTIDSNTMLKTVSNLGAICSVGNSKCQFTPSEEAAFSDSHIVKSEYGSPEMDLKDCAKSSVYEQCESNFGCMETYEQKMDTTNQLATAKYLHNSVSQSMSTPDVIIEEIIEDDQPCLLEPEKTTTLDSTKGKHLKKEIGHCKSKRLKKNQKMMGTCAPFCQKKISQELVYLRHFENPCNFYVQRLAQRTQVIAIERMITSLSQTCSRCHPTDVLELGEIIAFKSYAQKKWCRGSITELIPLESKCILKPCGPTRYRIEDLMRLTLFLLDYGSSETFVAARFARSMSTDSTMDCETKVDDLHEILTKLSSSDKESVRFFPALAVHCSLNIVPRSPDGLWAKEVKDYIFRMVGNRCVMMKVMREEHNKLMVDLRTPFENKINSDVPSSLRDALVWLELAKLPSNVSTALSKTVVTYYRDPVLPKNMTEVCVVVCHVNDPSDFYIHMIEESEYGTIMNKIQEVYNSRDAEDWQIMRPVVHQPCIAKWDTEDDDQWYRAEIIKLPNPQEAVIKYVDFGNVAKVNIASLRSLKGEFITLPRKAIGCRLAFIQPFNAGLWWSSEACQLFKDLTSYRRLRCNSIGVLLQNKLSVELFDINPSKVTSINTMLVKENVAAFIQPPSDSGDLDLPLMEVWDPVVDILPDPMEIRIDSKSLFERKELDVYISHVVSPSKFYVQWLTTENILKRLQVDLFERYENSKPEPIQWQVDMLAAVQLQSDKKWCRGKITNIISDRLVEVFCVDFGAQEVTDVSNLRKLDESLTAYGTLCLECALMDIKPAGGSPNWTATACDNLYYYLKGATVSMIIEDNTSQWPLPVKILSRNEANELVDVSEFLVKKGLALRDRRTSKQNPPLEATDIGTEQPAQGVLQEPCSVEEPVIEVNPECTKTETSELCNTPEPEAPAMESMVDDPYLPPLLPKEKTFLAKVQHVGECGTIYVIQECLENELVLLMLEIQESFRCLGLMAPYSWKKGEGCLIKGSDTMSYRGKVLDILGGDMITVQYEDFGYTEKIPKCHLYPSVYNSHVPRFCIPCRLNDILPVGDYWQPDAIQFLKELLLERAVTIHILEPPEYPNGVASVYIYCGNASVSAILEQYAYGIPRGCEKSDEIESPYAANFSCETIWDIDFQELLQNDLETPLLPLYSSEPLPRPGELFKVEVTHIQTPNDVFIRIKSESEQFQLSGSGDGDCDPMGSLLHQMNSKVKQLPFLTDFRTDMPCLAPYRDDLLHRAKLQSIKSYDPVTCVVEFVDYGSTAMLDTKSLFQIPASLLQYPAKAIKVKLAGFKAPKEDFQADRLLYCPEWSIKALFDMIDLVQKKTLSATCVAGSENAVFLYDDNQQLVHKPLITMGLAELDEM